MAVPSSRDARLFYRCAFQRYEDAQILLRDERTTGAVYLAGYGIECMLKALVLSVVSAGEQAAVLDSFRGNQGHNYEWLRYQYRLNGGAQFPREVNRHFDLANDWSTDLRYLPRTLRDHEARAFLAAAGAIIEWGDRRL